MRRVIVILIAVLFMLSGCGGHKGPQRPSRRMGEAPQADSAQIALMELNMQMAQNADRELQAIAQSNEGKYTLYEQGAWVHIIQHGDVYSEPIHDGEECVLHMRVSSLNGTLYYDLHNSYRIGQNELPAAVRQNIREWHHGSRMQILVPWYSAYGLSGTEVVPPYENVIIELEIE